MWEPQRQSSGDVERPPRVCVIPGDDAAPEAMAATLEVIEALGTDLTFEVVPTGDELASMSPADRIELVHAAIERADTTLFGASNGTTPGAVFLRWGLETYANVRPVVWRPGYRSPLRHPETLDYVIVRENLEDMYVGVMGDAADLERASLASERSRLPSSMDDARYAAKVISRRGTERVARFACELAVARRGRLTVSAKTNMLPATDRFFCDIVREVAQEYSDLEFEQFIVDDMAHRIVLRPETIDVLLVPNLYGDILSDAGAATLGGMGLAPSGCYGDASAYFESAHGTAPDLVGTGLVNPVATMLSAVMMLRYLRRGEAAGRLDDAVSRVLAAGEVVPVDQGGTASCREFSSTVAEAIASTR